MSIIISYFLPVFATFLAKLSLSPISFNQIYPVVFATRMRNTPVCELLSHTRKKKGNDINLKNGINLVILKLDAIPTIHCCRNPSSSGTKKAKHQKLNKNIVHGCEA